MDYAVLPAQALRRWLLLLSRALLKEHGVGSTSRWSKTKEAIAKEPRYKAVPRDQREQLFRVYTAELQVGPAHARVAKVSVQCPEGGGLLLSSRLVFSPGR